MMSDYNYRIGDFIEVETIANSGYAVWVRIPTGQIANMQTRHMDRFPKGRPEIGDRFICVVTHLKKKGFPGIVAWKEFLLVAGFDPEKSTIRRIEYSHDDYPLKFPELNDAPYKVGELVEATHTHGCGLGVMVDLPNGQKSQVDWFNTDQGEEERYLEWNAKAWKVVVLANRNDDRPYLSAKREHLAEYGHLSPEEVARIPAPPPPRPQSKYAIGDFVEVETWSTGRNSIKVKLPNQSFSRINNRNLDLGLAGRPAPGDRLTAVVIGYRKNGRPVLFAREEELLARGFDPEKSEVHKIDFAWEPPELEMQPVFPFKKGEAFEVSFFGHHWSGTGGDLEQSHRYYWNETLWREWVSWEESIEVDYQNIDKGPNGELPTWEQWSIIRVVVLGIESNNRPYLSVKKEHLEMYGYRANPFPLAEG